MMYIFGIAAIMIGILLDLIIGDPPHWPHIVKLMGVLIEKCEDAARRRIADNPVEKRRAGFVVWVIVVAVSALVPAAVLLLAWKINEFLYLVIASVLCYELIATKSLRDESMMVKKMLDNDDIHLARIRLSRIVGRQTEGLDKEHVIRAAVETVAENTNDACIAPLFYMALFGPVGGCIYKAVNTMDSMMGYKNEKYEDFGFFAAKADDVFGFIPARISAVLMIASAFLLRLDHSGAVHVFVRDRMQSESPNSGQCESVAAGALGIELLGDAVYFGKTVKRPAIGDGQRACENEDIEKVNDMLYLTVIIGAVLTLIWRLVWAKITGLF